MYGRENTYFYLFSLELQTGVFPFIAPFAHAVAAVLTAALTGSILFITSFPQGMHFYHFIQAQTLNWSQIYVMFGYKWIFIY